MWGFSPCNDLLGRAALLWTRNTTASQAVGFGAKKCMYCICLECRNTTKRRSASRSLRLLSCSADFFFHLIMFQRLTWDCFCTVAEPVGGKCQLFSLPCPAHVFSKAGCCLVHRGKDCHVFYLVGKLLPPPKKKNPVRCPPLEPSPSPLRQSFPPP